MSRQGKHREDKYRVQAYYEAQTKGLFNLVARLDGKTLTDTIRDSIYDRARVLGVLDSEYRVTEQFSDALRVEAMLIEQAEHKTTNTKGK